MLNKARAMIDRLAGRQHLAELDDRVYAILRDLEYLKAQVMAPAQSRVAPELSQRDRLRLHELRVYSQNGEDGLLLFLLATLGARTKRIAEIGIEDGSQCNARNLIETFGWSAVLVEGSPAYAASARERYAGKPVEVREAFVTAENAGALVDGELDVLSIDVDGVDYWIWKAIPQRPRIVIIEYNAYLPPEQARVVEYRPDFRRYELHPSGLYFGASLEALRQLGEARGYVLVGCDSAGANAIFVDRDEAAAAGLRALAARDAYYPLTSGRKHRPTPAEGFARIESMPFVTEPR